MLYAAKNKTQEWLPESKIPDVKEITPQSQTGDYFALSFYIVIWQEFLFIYIALKLSYINHITLFRKIYWETYIFLIFIALLFSDFQRITEHILICVLCSLVKFYEVLIQKVAVKDVWEENQLFASHTVERSRFPQVGKKCNEWR